MGYESKLYVVEKIGTMEENNKRYAKVIATFDMCKFGDFNDVFKIETDCYIYADDGDTQIIEDYYGKALTEASVSDVIEYLEKYQKEEEYYRRVAPLLGLLKGFDLSEWDNIKVLHFGH